MKPPESALPHRHARRRSWWLPGAVVAGVALLLSPLTETREQREFARALAKVATTIESGLVSGSLEVVRAKGLPKQFAGFKADGALAAPDRWRIQTTIEREPIQAARDGQRVWIAEPGKSFGVIGEAGVPRFSTAPETSRDATRLEPLRFPLDWKVRAILPRLLSLQRLSAETIDEAPCAVLRGTLQPWLAERWKLPRGTATFWLRESDHFPVRIAYQEGDRVDALLTVSKLHLGEAIAASQWQPPAEAGLKLEHVALSHLTKFASSALKLASTTVRPLGPAQGVRRVVATHGRGRLEDYDGTRLLFLRGTPEEMGQQHGVLLKAQVRDLVERVLYGVGVGSSFAKGRWFFGEIEQAQQRIGRFIDPRYLREMDALAAAAGLEKEELRLANFFPELFHCSGFALMGDATVGGRIFHGRILDYMKGVGLEGNATLIVYQPDEGHAWANVSYAGFVGTVTAMNDQHISIGEMGGRGEGNWDGKPMAQLLREVMEKASTLDEAVEILRHGPRTCEYFYVVADGKAHTAVGIAATPDTFEVVHPGEAHPRLATPVRDTVLLSAGDRYTELVRRAQEGFGKFDADSARALMTRPVCMGSNIHSVLFAPDTLDFWVANADSVNVASHARYTQYNLAELLASH